MPTTNSFYNPEWEEIYAQHEQQRNYFEKERDRIYPLYLDQKEKFETTYKSIECNWEFHHRICLYCLDTLQHKTVQDYWKWATNSITIKNAFDKIEIDQPDPESFTSIKEASKYLSNLYTKSQKFGLLESNESPVSSPENPETYLGIFEENRDSDLSSEWMTFNVGLPNTTETIEITTLVFTDKRKDQIHVCFYTDTYKGRTFVIPCIRELAKAYIDKNAPENSSTKKWWNFGKIQPTKHQFYAYVMPTRINQEIIMAFPPSQNSYNVPDKYRMRPYHAIPAYLKNSVKDQITLSGISTTLN